MNDFLKKNLNIYKDSENLKEVLGQVRDEVHIRDTNLVILIIAIIICSVGLNINSTPVIIGAMLLSPIMKPIVGFGLALGTYDMSLLKSSFKNVVFSFIFSVFASTLYFFISPIDVVYSEILARTSPTIYDVLIAFFGGAAAMIALTTKQKGNVIPGAAIATALLPPLCTIGFGFANGMWIISLGAFYLFLINLIFISLSALIIAKILPFPKHIHTDKSKVDEVKKIVYISLFFLIIPSVYFAYQTVLENRFSTKINKFIKEEIHLKNAYILQKNINQKENKVVLVYGGEKISSSEIEEINKKMSDYGLPNSTISFQEGFTYLDNSKSEAKKIVELQTIVLKQAEEIKDLKKIQSEDSMRELSQKILEEFPTVSKINTSNRKTVYSLSGSYKHTLIEISTRSGISDEDKKILEDRIHDFSNKNYVDIEYQIEK